MAENSWQKPPSALSQESAACVGEIHVCSTTGSRERIFSPFVKNEPIKLTAEIFTEGNDE